MSIELPAMTGCIAIPRYKVNTKQKDIDKNAIVVELYTLAAAGRRKPWVEHKKEKDLEAPIEDELKPLMTNIPLLEDNARSYLRELE